MDLRITPGPLSGAVRAISSKSQAHRLLICAALADGPTELVCPDTNRDMEATATCLNALGASIERTACGYRVLPLSVVPAGAVLPCGESGSTLRFLLPVAGALGVDARFLPEGRLPRRPLSPLWEEMERMGCSLSRPDETSVRCTGQLVPGDYFIDGSISSQFITGLLFASSILGGSTVTVTGQTESRPYIDMTRQALSLFQADRFPFHTPGRIRVEGDWSNAAFFLTAGALGNSVTVTGLDPASLQGDRAIADLLPRMDRFVTIDCRDIPDLVPILAVAAGAKAGALFTGIRRLRLKESDRVEAIVALIRDLGGRAQADENTLRVFPTDYRGGLVHSRGDHRIAMAAAIAAVRCTEPVVIRDASCVSKSYPGFWDDYSRLGGNYEQHLW